MDTPNENKEMQTESVAQTPVTEVAPEIVAAAPTATSVSTPWYRRPITASILIAILIFAGAGYYLYNSKYKNGGVVATVNGTPIYGDAYEENLRLMTEGATAQGVDLTDAETAAQMRTQALDSLIDNALLLNAASAAGITIDEEAIGTIYDQLVTQMGGVETLKQRMAEIGLSEEALRKNIQERILIDTYIESISEIESLTVTDEEITTFMATFVAADTELPPIEEIRPVIESQILTLKRQEIMEGIIRSLRTDATIEVRI